jgi:hypothetical protein
MLKVVTSPLSGGQRCRTRRQNYSSTSTSFSSSIENPLQRSRKEAVQEKKPRRDRLLDPARLQKPRRERVLDRWFEGGGRE